MPPGTTPTHPAEPFLATVHRLTPARPGQLHLRDRIWYASYGSNMDAALLRYYLRGGRPPDAARTYPGCRDQRPPLRSEAIEFPGRMYFATESPVWRGGRAFYDSAADGRVWGRAHLITAGQFSDIATQEMYEPPGADLDFDQVLADGRAVLGPGRYQTLVLLGHLDTVPVLTFTAPWRLTEVPWTKPTGRYLLHLARGLLTDAVRDASAVTRYLSRCPGAANAWTLDELAALIAEARTGPRTG
ncbi:histone deacetylase [Streptomyces xantholiticus]